MRIRIRDKSYRSDQINSAIEDIVRACLDRPYVWFGYCRDGWWVEFFAPRLRWRKVYATTPWEGLCSIITSNADYFAEHCVSLEEGC